ncbi:MAG: DMT family transporter [Alphaproteobacteria bacterium]|nr:DMT family transporter [Alphaproteobacteria bacterium]
MVGAMALFALLDANSKLLAGRYGANQVLFLRYGTLLALLGLLRLWRPGTGGPLSTAWPGQHLLRALCMAGSAYGFFLAFREIPLAEGYLVYFTAPFFTLLLAALVLGEKNGRAVWFWSAMGFLGVIVAMAPGLSAAGPWDAYAWAFLGTMTYAGFLTISRVLRSEQGAARLIFWSSGPLFLAILPFAMAEWVMPDAYDWLALILNGLFAGGATLALALAFSIDRAARLAPLEFSSLVFALLLDAAIWHLWPGGWTLAGAAIVVFACLMSERATRTR